jgi:hypothetical protein
MQSSGLPHEYLQRRNVAIGCIVAGVADEGVAERTRARTRSSAALPDATHDCATLTPMPRGRRGAFPPFSAHPAARAEVSNRCLSRRDV